jgi:hypothetical protein
VSAQPDPLVRATCERAAPDASAALLTWARGIENGRTVWTCDTCSREHLRAVWSHKDTACRGLEGGKLDSAWW